MLRPRQAVNLVVAAAFFLHCGIVVQVVKLAIFETVFVLLHLRRPQDFRQRVAEVHSADFAPLGRPYFGLVPCVVVPHTAAYRQVLLVQIDVLPGQTADLANRRQP